MADDGFRALMDHLQVCHGLQMSGIGRHVLERRCRERAQRVGCSTFYEYVQYLEASPTETEALLNIVLVKETRFYREPLTYAMLQDRIFPEMVRNRAGGEEHFLRLWSVGCATGEEPYTLALLALDAAERHCEDLHVHVLATDRDGEALKTARAGVYAHEQLRDLPFRLVERFLQCEGCSYRVVPELRRVVRYVEHDLLYDEPAVPLEAIFKDFDLISCQNMLMYYDGKAQETMVRRLHGALEMGGLLVLGAAESLPQPMQWAFQRLDGWSAVYRRVA